MFVWLIVFDGLTKLVTVLAFILWNHEIAIASFATNYREVHFVLSPGNRMSTLRLCTGQRYADAIADYLLLNGMHDERFIPESFELQGILYRLCNEIYANRPSEEQHCVTDSVPSLFRNDGTKYTTINFGEEGSEGSSVVVYLRQGYDARQLCSCVCEKLVCEDGVQQAIETYLEGIISNLRG